MSLLSAAMPLCILMYSMPIFAAKKSEPPAMDANVMASKLLDLHNAARAKEHLPPLKLNDSLMKAAQGYAQFLADSGKFGHEEKGTPSGRMKDAGYKGHAYGENIARGQRSVDAVMDAWMHSTGHRENILRKTYKEVGFGVVRDKEGRLVWVTDFGAK